MHISTFSKIVEILIQRSLQTGAKNICVCIDIPNHTIELEDDGRGSFCYSTHMIATDITDFDRLELISKVSVVPMSSSRRKIIVSNIFFCFQARRRAVREMQELQEIRDVAIKLLMPYPAVHILVNSIKGSDLKSILTISAHKSAADRYCAFHEVVNLYPFELDSKYFQLQGFISIIIASGKLASSGYAYVDLIQSPSLQSLLDTLFQSKPWEAGTGMTSRHYEPINRFECSFLVSIHMDKVKRIHRSLSSEEAHEIYNRVCSFKAQVFNHMQQQQQGHSALMGTSSVSSGYAMYRLDKAEESGRFPDQETFLRAFSLPSIERDTHLYTDQEQDLCFDRRHPQETYKDSYGISVQRNTCSAENYFDNILLVTKEGHNSIQSPVINCESENDNSSVWNDCTIDPRPPIALNCPQKTLDNYDNLEENDFKGAVALPVDDSFTATVPRKVTQLMKDGLKDFSVVGQCDQKFIIGSMQSSDGGVSLICLDQHAIDERIRLESFDEITPQWICHHQSTAKVTERIQLSEQNLVTAEQFRGLLESWGFLFTFARERKLIHVLLAQVPTILGEPLSGADFKEFLDFINLNAFLPSSFLRPPSVQRILASKACRSALKFGTSISIEESVNLVRKLALTKLPFQCAHGRPSTQPLLDMKRLHAERHLKLKNFFTS